MISQSAMSFRGSSKSASSGRLFVNTVEKHGHIHSFMNWIQYLRDGPCHRSRCLGSQIDANWRDIGSSLWSSNHFHNRFEPLGVIHPHDRSEERRVGKER